MTTVLVACSLGTVEVDLDDEDEAEVVDDEVVPPPAPAVDLPLLVTAAAHGSTVLAVVDRRPPLVVSHDGGATWRETGAGLRPGVAVAISPDHPDLAVYATGERLHVSRDGGRFWAALPVELPGITAVAFR
jgi:hypothetical protein